MEHKLKLNDHKGGWEETSIERLFELLDREVQELKNAITDKEGWFNIMLEAADVANFAMMIAWNTMRGQGRVSMEPSRTTNEIPTGSPHGDPHYKGCDCQICTGAVHYGWRYVCEACKRYLPVCGGEKELPNGRSICVECQNCGGKNV